MKKTLLAGVAALAMLSVSAAAEPDLGWENIEKDGKFYLGFNNGGRLDLYIERWKIVAASGDDVEIRGPCPSACTLVTVYVPKARIPGASHVHRVGLVGIPSQRCDVLL